MSEATYYQRSREVILNRPKDYYENNKELLRERAKNKYSELSEEEKNIRREYEKKKKDITCLKKRLKNQKNIKNIIVRLKSMLHKCKRVSKSLLQICTFFVLLLILKRIKCCFNNIIKVLCIAKWAIHESFLLLLKHHFILFKINH